MSSDSHSPFKSSYEPLTLPEGGFVSKIPPHLLHDCDEQTRWLMNEISRASQAIDWTCQGLVETHDQVRRTNGRLLKAESDLSEVHASVTTLNDKATVMEPIFKPLAQFMGLWQYTWFRWICYAALFFFFTYALPYYLVHPISLDTLFNHLLGP